MQKVIVNTANQEESTSNQFDNNKHEKPLGFLSAKSSSSFVYVYLYFVEENLTVEASFWRAVR